MHADPSLPDASNDGSAYRKLGDPSLPDTSNDGWAGMRHGVRLGLDPGDARIGVARSDPSGLLATPVETVPRGRGDLARIAEILLDLGYRVVDVKALFDFEVQQANGLATSDMLLQVRDVETPVPGLTFERSFHGMTVTGRFEDGPLGLGWTHNWQWSLEKRPDQGGSTRRGTRATDRRQLGSRRVQLEDGEGRRLGWLR